MDIKDYLFENSAVNDVEIASKEDAIDMLIDLHFQAGNISDREEYKRALMTREAALSTELGGGVAVPHAKSRAVNRASLALLTLKNPIQWGKNTVQKIYMLASPDERSHLEMLSALADTLQNEANEI